MFSTILVISISILYYIRYAESSCGMCGATSGVLCLTTKTFRPCFDGVAGGNVTTCPGGTVCWDSAEICGNWTTTVPDCRAPPSICGTCSSDHRFACLNATTFAYCFGTTAPSSKTGKCPAGTCCDISATMPSFCSVNSNATCISKPPPSYPHPYPPTSPATLTASEYCMYLKARDGLRYAAPFPSNCKQFVYCFILNNTLRGNYYLCSGSTIFNNNTGDCVPPASYTCPEGQ